MIPQWRWEETRSRWVCVAGEILVPGVLSWRRRRDAAREASGEAARENSACRISYEFWMPPIFVSSVGTVWLPSQEEWCNRYWSDPQTSQAKRNNQVTDRNNYMLQVIQDPGRVLSSYSKFLETKTSIQRWFSHNKKLYASKEVKRSPLNCFRGQILSENKKPHESNPGMPRKHIS